MAEGNTWYEGANQTWICKEICDDPEKLVVMKVNRLTGEIRYDRFIPNPHYSNERHTHEWNSSSSKNGQHSENTNSNTKKKLY